MKFKHTLRGQLLIFIIIPVIVIYVSIIAYFSYNFKRIIFDDAVKYTQSYSDHIVSEVKSYFEEQLYKSRVYASSFEILSQNKNQAVEKYNALLKSWLEDDTVLVSTWVSWELNYIDKNFRGEHGRARNIIYKNKKGEIQYSHEKLDILEEEKGLYYQQKMSKKIPITEPYKFSFQNSNDTILMTSMGVQLIVDGKFVGLLGCDYPLNRFQEKISKIKVFNSGYAFLLSNKGVYIAHPNSTLLGQTFHDVNPYEDSLFQVSKKIERGDFFSFWADQSNTKQKLYVFFKPIFFKGVKEALSLGFIIPINEVYAKNIKVFYYTIILAVIGIIILFVIIYIMTANLNILVKRSLKLTENLKEGQLNNKIEVSGKTELTTLILNLKESSNTLKETIKQVKENAQKISNKGNNLLQNAREIVNDAKELNNASLQTDHSIMNIQQQDQETKEFVFKVTNVNNDLNNFFSSASKEFEEVLDLSNQTNYKIEQVKEIAKKTDLLSINAAIAAARAGNKDFAVVADEIKKLAAKSQETADVITKLSAQNLEKTRKNKEQIQKLSPSLQEVSQLLINIKNQTEKQHEQIELLSSISIKLQELVNNSDISSNNLDSNAKELNLIAEKLNKSVQFFKF